MNLKGSNILLRCHFILIIALTIARCFLSHFPVLASILRLFELAILRAACVARGATPTPLQRRAVSHTRTLPIASPGLPRYAFTYVRVLWRVVRLRTIKTRRTNGEGQLLYRWYSRSLRPNLQTNRYILLCRLAKDPRPYLEHTEAKQKGSSFKLNELA